MNPIKTMRYLEILENMSAVITHTIDNKTGIDIKLNNKKIHSIYQEALIDLNKKISNRKILWGNILDNFSCFLLQLFIRSLQEENVIPEILLGIQSVFVHAILSDEDIYKEISFLYNDGERNLTKQIKQVEEELYIYTKKMLDGRKDLTVSEVFEVEELWLSIIDVFTLFVLLHTGITNEDNIFKVFIHITHLFCIIMTRNGKSLIKEDYETKETINV